MAHLTCRELLNLTHPGEYEAGVLKLPHVVAVRAAPAETGRFRNRLHMLQGRETTFYRASLEGRGSWTICDSGDQLELQVFISYAEMFWQTPQRTLHQAPLPVLVLPEQELQLRASDLRIWVAHFSYRRMFSEVAIAREGVVSPTLFLAQGRPSARLQCRRIMDEIAAGLELGLSEDSLALLERALITTVAHHWTPDPRSYETSYRHVTLAMDWMQLYLSQPFAWSELCRQVGVSQRCLEISFQQELGLSPNRWLKQERLRSLRQLLLDRDCCIGVPLPQLFESCGLPYCGSTQRAYNRLYGETPAHTRHRVSRRIRLDDP